MYLKNLLVAAIFVSFGTIANAQNSKDNNETSKEALAVFEQQHLRDAQTHHKKETKAFKWRRGNVKHTAQYEYYNRVEAAAKERKRTLKKLSKPQYYDFMYYGHKRKPKKHSAGELRYCKECGIRH